MYALKGKIKYLASLSLLPHIDKCRLLSCMRLLRYLPVSALPSRKKQARYQCDIAFLMGERWVPSLQEPKHKYARGDILYWFRKWTGSLGIAWFFRIYLSLTRAWLYPITRGQADRSTFGTVTRYRPRWRLLLSGRITPQVLDFTLECWSHLLLVASFISHFSVWASHLVLVFFFFYSHVFHHYVSIWSLCLDTLCSVVLQLIAQASLSQFSLSWS